MGAEKRPLFLADTPLNSGSWGAYM